MSLPSLSKNEKLILASVVAVLLLFWIVVGGYVWVKSKEYDLSERPLSTPATPKSFPQTNNISVATESSKASPTTNNQNAENLINGKVVKFANDRIRVAVDGVRKDFNLSTNLQVARLIYPTPANGMSIHSAILRFISDSELKAEDEVSLSLTNDGLVETILIK